MIEVEIKIKVKDRVLLEDKLLKAGFLKGNLVKESDIYFDNQAHQIKDSDSALRIRSCENLTLNHEKHFMTYKGPKLDTVSMTRKEVEMQIEDAQTGKEILMSLGYCLVYPVVKTRQYYHLDQITACLDQVDNLGEFLELEVIISKENEKQKALDSLLLFVKEFGYDPEEMVRTSYLSMLLAQTGRFMQAVENVKREIEKLLSEKDSVIVAIDGRCASGKTTFAHGLQQELACNVVHMDDFFLRPEQRTAERLQTPGENVDHERFLEEVLLPYKENRDQKGMSDQVGFGQENNEQQNNILSYRPYDCHTQQLKAPVCIVPNQVLIVEGAYACHKSLFDHYDLHIFLDVEPDVQMERIVARNGAEQAKRFQERWIPLEERYLAAFEVKEQCEMWFEL